MTAVQQLAAKKLCLSPSERADMTQLLLQSLETSENHELEWLEVAEKRRSDLISRKVKSIGWKEVKSFALKK